MSPQHTDYSLALGVFAAVAGLCVILTVWYAARGFVEFAPQIAA